jgi:hypothetical protein
MEITTTTPLRSISTTVGWCDDCTVYGDSCYDCAVTAEMLTD